MEKNQVRPGLTRREVLVGAAAAAMVAAAPSVLASPKPKQRGRPATNSRESTTLRRYMAASAPLGDGRVLVMGGYDRPWSGQMTPKALRSAVIIDPATGTSVDAAPMNSPRARHAAVVLSDGRIVAIGGMSEHPLSSIEVYDPVMNTWAYAEPLARPRYDHTAVADGQIAYVLGGSSLSILSSVERVQLDQ